MVSYVDIQERVKTIQNRYNLNYYELLQRFMFERILERISLSEYKDNFILKGGLLLSAMFGVDNRTTKDMDVTIKGIDVSKDKMLNVLNEILSIDLKDGVKFDVIDITDIREDDEYGGNKYHIVARLQNMKVNLEIDISTGDEVTPRELEYKYPLLFEDKSIIISSYNLETILSEKIETVLRRGKYNSRMKDYYDIYMFLTRLYKEIDFRIMNEALINTFKKRDSFTYLNDYEMILDSLKENEKINVLWNKYIAKNVFAKNIEFGEIVLLLENFIKKLDLIFILI